MDVKILVVDDDRIMLDMLRIRLEKRGYMVITALSGEECMEKAVEEMPSVILLDVILPGQNGFEVCKWLKGNEKTKDIHVILITALIGESAKQQGSECGADYLISKPFDPDDLMREIEVAIEKEKI